MRTITSPLACAAWCNSQAAHCWIRWEEILFRGRALFWQHLGGRREARNTWIALVLFFSLCVCALGWHLLCRHVFSRCVSWPGWVLSLKTGCDTPWKLFLPWDLPTCSEDMLLSPKFSLSTIHVRLTAKGLLRNLRLPSGFRKSTVIFHTGLSGVGLCLVLPGAGGGGRLDEFTDVPRNLLSR